MIGLPIVRIDDIWNCIFTRSGSSMSSSTGYVSRPSSSFEFSKRFVVEEELQSGALHRGADLVVLARRAYCT